jgi:hypothetical protein
MHQTAGDILHTLLTCVQPPHNLQQANHSMDSTLATTIHATRCSIHHVLGMLPGTFLVFQCNVFLNIPLMANLWTIQDRRQVLIDKNLDQQNPKCRSFDYVIEQEVLIKVHNPCKLDDKVEGPYTITQVHVNGTVTIQ